MVRGDGNGDRRVDVGGGTRGERVEAPAAGDLAFHWTDAPPGVYALSAVHDENSDGVMQRRDDGWPLEGWALSNGDAVMGAALTEAMRHPTE